MQEIDLFEKWSKERIRFVKALLRQVKIKGHRDYELIFEIARELVAISNGLIEEGKRLGIEAAQELESDDSGFNETIDRILEECRRMDQIGRLDVFESIINDVLYFSEKKARETEQSINGFIKSHQGCLECREMVMICDETLAKINALEEEDRG